MINISPTIVIAFIETVIASGNLSSFVCCVMLVILSSAADVLAVNLLPNERPRYCHCNYHYKMIALCTLIWRRKCVTSKYSSWRLINSAWLMVVPRSMENGAMWVFTACKDFRDFHSQKRHVFLLLFHFHFLTYFFFIHFFSVIFFTYINFCTKKSVNIGIARK